MHFRKMGEKKRMSKDKMVVENLDLYYGNFQALKNINLRLPENEISAFIGLPDVVNPHC